MTNLDAIVKGTKTATETLKKAIEYGFDMGYMAHAAGQDANPAKGDLFQWLDERAKPTHLVSVKPWYIALGIAYKKDLKAPEWRICALDMCGNMRLKGYTEQEWHEKFENHYFTAYDMGNDEYEVHYHNGYFTIHKDFLDIKY